MVNCIASENFNGKKNTMLRPSDDTSVIYEGRMVAIAPLNTFVCVNNCNNIAIKPKFQKFNFFYQSFLYTMKMHTE